MSRRTKLSEASFPVLQAAAAPLRFAAGAAGEAGSQGALAKLDAAVVDLRAMAVQPLLRQALADLTAGDHASGEIHALKALEVDERCGVAWYILAFARERAGDFVSSIRSYEMALALLPDHAEVANDLGRLAYRMGMIDQAEQLFRHYLARHPQSHEGANNLACALRDLHRSGEAIELLRAAIAESPEEPLLWNTLGSVVSEQGDFANATVFFEESLRLDPKFPKARHNLGNARLSLGDPKGALEACDAALQLKVSVEERLMMRLLRSTILIALGRLAEGWTEYEARLDPNFADVTLYQVAAPRWTPGADLAGKALLVVGEQGLGDEILFANVLEDVIAALGSQARLTLAVEPRLVTLFQRSFPDARVGAHATFSVGGRTVRTLPFLDGEPPPDLWTPMGCLLREHRASVAAFPSRRQFMSADPARLAHWRRVLEAAPQGVKVGLLWKSLVKASGRQRFFSPFDQWAPILATPGVTFVNLQYGDCAAEIAAARERFGIEIWTPPGIDLKQDLDDVAALCCAMDLVVGFSNASLNLGAACGAPTWLISTPGAWARLGEAGAYPWYPQVRVFAPQTLGAWDTVMAEIAAALGAFVADSPV